MSRNILIVAGEVSGDQHAASLMAALKSKEPDLFFWGLGGDKMVQQGLDALYHVKDLSVTGFIEVLKQIRFFRRVMRNTLSACEQRKPDAAILLDYPGFNIRLGVRLMKLNVPVYYYISPQVWAWHQSRVKTMRTFIKRMFVIFPFEKTFYEKAGIPVSFYGHPILDVSFNLPTKEAFFNTHQLHPDRPLVALLPGSRRNELQRHTTYILDAVEEILSHRPDIQFAVASLSSIPHELRQPYYSHPAVHVVENDPYPLVKHADLAIVASGTATLETAYLNTPMVVIYRMAPLSYALGKLLVDIDHLAMPNLIANERVVPELIQRQVNGPDIAAWVLSLLDDKTLAHEMRIKLEKVKLALGKPGCAEQVANEILKELN